MMFNLTHPLCILIVVAGCAPSLPGIEATITPTGQNANFPVLQPLEPLLARTGDDVQIRTDSTQLAQKVANLRARAAALRGQSIIDGATRLRLSQAVSKRAL